MRSNPLLALVALLALASPLRAANPDRDPNTVLRDASQSARDRARLAEAVTTVTGVANNAKADPAVRERAYELLVDLQLRHGLRAKAIEAAEAFRLAFPTNALIDRQAVFIQAVQYLQMPAAPSNSTPAVAALQSYVKRRAADSESCAQAYLYIARFQLRVDQYDAAQAAARTALELDPANADLGSEALWVLQDASQRAKRPEDRAKALEQSLDPKYRPVLTDDALTARRSACADTLRELKRYDDLRRYLADFERSDTSPLRRQQWCLALANAHLDQGQTEEAKAGYERVFNDHPGVNACWFEAQSRIVDYWVGQKRIDDALRAAHILYDAAPNSDAADRVVKRIVDLLRTADAKDPRADAFAAMHRYGPNGRDGQAGTADDLQSVLSAIGYPDTVARRQAFAAAASSLGDGSEASLQRAWCAVYVGDPRLALSHFADALRRCAVLQVADITKAAQFNGFRPLRGHSDGLSEVGQFVAYGPVGADGQPGTDDDLTDPFADLGVPAVSAQPGGLVPLTPDEVRNLQSLISELRKLIRQSPVSARQVAALGIYQRAVEALVLVDRAETLSWVLSVARAEKDEPVVSALVRFGANVARADQLHCAATRQFYTDVTRTFEEAQRRVPAEVAGSLKHFDAAIHVLVKKQPGR